MLLFGHVHYWHVWHQRRNYLITTTKNGLLTSLLPRAFLNTDLAQLKPKQCFSTGISVSRQVLSSPIKNMWSELKRDIHKPKPKTIRDHERVCMQEWSYPCQGSLYQVLKTRVPITVKPFFFIYIHLQFKKRVIFRLQKLNIFHMLENYNVSQ